MKYLKLYSVVTFVLLFITSQGFAENCSTDPIVKRWIGERDAAERHVIQAWAKGATEESYLSDIAIILSNELYLSSFCRNNKTFLHNQLHVLSTASDPKIETVPGIILERFIGYPLLSPKRQYEFSKKGRDRNDW